jgi:uncharacterized Rossmann fold enzyme
MSAPLSDVVQIEYQNPQASSPLFMPVRLICNTSDEELQNNIRINSRKNLEWLKSEKEKEGFAILVGGGPSIEDELENIRSFASYGGTVFAMNGASKWLHEHGIEVDYQCIADAQEETATLIDHQAKAHIIGSQVHPKTMDAIENPIVWHIGIEDIESFFPEEKVKKGGYAILGGGGAVGNCATCVAYALGFRDLRIFGFDSSHKDSKSHAYEQPMNLLIPTITTKWAGREFRSSIAMKAHAEKFMFTSNALKDAGCNITVYGDGLLQTMYNTPTENLTEQEKYQLMWQYDAYREESPGERVADFYVFKFKPEGRVIDFGCGSGKGSVKLAQSGLNVLAIDFTDNCRDEEAQSIPFLQWDLTKPIPTSAENGFCTDVLEHIPTDDVPVVISNIMKCAEKVFFQISTMEDSFGVVLNTHLHLTVKPHSWWKSLIESLGYVIKWDSEHEVTSMFYVENPMETQRRNK